MVLEIRDRIVIYPIISLPFSVALSRGGSLGKSEETGEVAG